MRRRLLFVDDDKTELADFAAIVGAAYEYTPVHWPTEESKLWSVTGLEVFVCDLHLPLRTGDTTPTPGQRSEAKEAARRVAKRFAELYPDPPEGADTLQGDKARLRDTMDAVLDAYKLLDLERSALGQSSEHGIALMREVRTRYPEIPFVFYSRKITTEEVVRVLKAGATDAIRKGALNGPDLLKRLAAAQDAWARKELQELRTRGMNANVTVIP